MIDPRVHSIDCTCGDCEHPKLGHAILNGAIVTLGLPLLVLGFLALSVWLLVRGFLK